MTGPNFYIQRLEGLAGPINPPIAEVMLFQELLRIAGGGSSAVIDNLITQATAASDTASVTFLTNLKALSTAVSGNGGPQAENNAGNSGAALTVNWATSANQKVTLTANCTLTLSNPVAGSVYVLKLVQDGTGSRTVTWPGTVKWPGGAAPTLTTTAAATDIITLYFDGTNYFASSGLAYA